MNPKDNFSNDTFLCSYKFWKHVRRLKIDYTQQFRRNLGRFATKVLSFTLVEGLLIELGI